MSNRIDRAGTFIASIAEHALGVTKKGFPQLVARFKATKKFVGDADEMKHFGLTEPGFVDWSQFDEEIVGFMVMFKSAEEFSDATKLLNYEQLQLALGWDGTEFDSLANGQHVGKEVLIRVKEDTYEGKTDLKVDWIDSKDASPVAALKNLDADAVKGLAAKLKIGKPAAAPAKPAAKPAKPPVAAAAPATPPAAAPAPAPAPAPAAPAAPAPAAPKPPSKGKKKAEPKAEETAPPPAAEKPALPKEVTQADAWAYVVGNKGGNEDQAVEEAWIAACQEVGENKDEDDFTNADWARVRDIVIKDLAL